jgi:hypothetical protein
MSGLFINFEGILSRIHEKFEEQNKFLEPSIIIICYCIIITNAHLFVLGATAPIGPWFPHS